MPSEWESTRLLGVHASLFFFQEKENSVLGAAQEHECGSHYRQEEHTWPGAEESQRAGI